MKRKSAAQNVPWTLAVGVPWWVSRCGPCLRWVSRGGFRVSRGAVRCVVGVPYGGCPLRWVSRGGFPVVASSWVSRCVWWLWVSRGGSLAVGVPWWLWVSRGGVFLRWVSRGGWLPLRWVSRCGFRWVSRCGFRCGFPYGGCPVVAFPRGGCPVVAFPWWLSRGGSFPWWLFPVVALDMARGAVFDLIVEAAAIR